MASSGKSLSSRSLIKKYQNEGFTEAVAVNWAMRVKLNEVQEELRKLFEQQEEKTFQIQNRTYRKQKHVYEKRSELLRKKFNNFWSETLLSHPDLREIVLPEEEKCLQFLEDLNVVPFQRVENGYRIELVFRENPYFSNQKLVKVFQLTADAGKRFQPQSSSTKIIWKENGDLTRKRSKSKKGFFKWFLDNSDPFEDEISEVIKDEIWTNPLTYAFPNYVPGQGQSKPKKEVVKIEETEVVVDVEVKQNLDQEFCRVPVVEEDDPMTVPKKEVVKIEETELEVEMDVKQDLDQEFCRVPVLEEEDDPMTVPKKEVVKIEETELEVEMDVKQDLDQEICRVPVLEEEKVDPMTVITTPPVDCDEVMMIE